ncbi:histidine kinase [Conexibacter sp. W3-3-2]|uniref:histidine kinase n=1 Tax=Paraconexibacter algicola TaxID=2133960 RepID=A0A2T4UGL4_9ACTN|nr:MULTISPECIES: histidine kinase [Solirubrobacterales]MTD44617.1 histidine kinase [Conexibacter sp. W3-3-2]PTL58357.1 histidine kinase [Paraconexibacter algicola]
MSSVAGDLTAQQPERPPRRGRLTGLRDAHPGALISAAGLAVVVAGLACTLVWALLGADTTYWPVWVWIGGGAPVAAAAAVRVSWRIPAGPARWASAHAGVGAVAATLLACIWLLTGGGFWLAWVLFGMGLALSVHALLAFADRLPPRPREKVLSARVDELVRTRRAALDEQAIALARIERDLHDGAQARLVALSLALGRAEQRLGEDHDAAPLVRDARREATAAIAELRDLARGIAPPMLQERGLVAAVEALAHRSSVAVDVRGALPDRLPPSTERAAYFVVAESLTNVAKHAPDARATVSLFASDGALWVEVADDGPGGADPAGTGLLGLRSRVEALDGRLTVTDLDPTGTRVRAELPCAS